MATSDYFRANRGHKGIDSGYRARKGIGKKLKGRLGRRVGKNLIKLELLAIENEPLVEQAEWEAWKEQDEYLTWHSDQFEDWHNDVPEVDYDPGADIRWIGCEAIY